MSILSVLLYYLLFYRRFLFVSYCRSVSLFVNQCLEYLCSLSYVPLQPFICSRAKRGSPRSAFWLPISERGTVCIAVCCCVAPCTSISLKYSTAAFRSSRAKCALL